eukprot:8511118-Pyramimonas_sp.AAC.1
MTLRALTMTLRALTLILWTFTLTLRALAVTLRAGVASGTYPTPRTAGTVVDVDLKYYNYGQVTLRTLRVTLRDLTAK